MLGDDPGAHLATNDIQGVVQVADAAGAPCGAHKLHCRRNLGLHAPASELVLFQLLWRDGRLKRNL